MPHRISLVAALLVPLLFVGAASAELPLVFEDDFEQGSEQLAKRWKPTDAAAWKLVDGKSGKAYSLFQQSNYKPPFRSPVNISLVDDVAVTDFRLEADVLSTKADYPHRSMIMVFGYQDPAHFYYVHFGKKMDDHANQIFIVDGAARLKISTKTTDGTNWDDAWHHVKIERNAASGDIKIFFDDMQAPVMTAVDKKFTWGQVGLGSFDDIGDWDNVKLWGTKK
ncbi:MAG: hypothetical protein K8U03_25300 [Planctomycetia bacterium]|nr:hypothetical protein [Planctomycetia bacterium]